ncbi:retron-type RNA-directed DNA polymerase [Dehalogenimonas sp. WBC-2]|nr:retron-type RNA-directed DNA polymerase [Dehalogenimonas sp. WBC-2]
MNSLPLLVSLEHTPDVIAALNSEFNMTEIETRRAISLLDKGLPPLFRPEVIAYLFGVSHRLVSNMSRFSDNYYRCYKIPKKSGGFRNIETPRIVLKVIQRWINTSILSKIVVPEYITGFAEGRNIFVNGHIHIGTRNMLVIDIADFFPSVFGRKVMYIFRNLGFPVQVARLLTGLCLYQKRLPQGAPTSPALANHAFHSVDVTLEELASEWGCNYSRYADDIAFSGERFFEDSDLHKIEDILEQHKFRINHNKSHISGSGSRKMLAGLVISEKCIPPRKKRKIWRAIFHNAANNPAILRDKLPYLRGVACFVKQYDEELYQKYRIIIDSVAP